MKAYWLLVLLLCCLFVRSNGDGNNASRPAVINIGALFNFNSTIGKVAKIAIQEAVNDVNSNSSILHGSKLNLTMRDSVCSGFLGFIQGILITPESLFLEILGARYVTMLGKFT